MNQIERKGGKKRKRLIVYGALALLLLVLFYLGIRRAYAELGFSGLVTKTIEQVGETVAFIGSYVRGEDYTRSDDSDPLDREPPTSIYAELPPPVEGETVILSSGATRFPFNTGTFIINTNLQAGGSFSVLGDSRFGNIDAGIFSAEAISGGALSADTIAAGALTTSSVATERLTVGEAFTVLGLLSAPGGINLQGATLDVSGGSIIGLDYVRALEAGENVVIAENNGTYTISVPDIRRGGGGGNAAAGVTSLNGLSGALSLIAGDDISLSGLTISNTSTLETVRARGGCNSCILDSDVVDSLTISGGVIDDTVIGSTTRAAGYFSTLSIGTNDTSSALVVGGSGSFTGGLTADTGFFSGRVRGADAVDLDEFVTLSQVLGMMGGPGGVAGVISLNALTGAITLAGTPGQVALSPSGNVLTFSLPQNIDISSSPTFADMVLTGLLTVGGNVDVSGVVSATGFVSSPTDASVRKSGEEILRMTVSIFPYALPADTGSTTFTKISKTFSAFDNPAFVAPSALGGTSRRHRFVIKYSDTIPAGSSEWRVFEPSSGTTVDSFMLSGVNTSTPEEPTVVVTDPVSVPSGDWQLEVRVPDGRIRIMDIHIVALDVVN